MHTDDISYADKLPELNESSMRRKEKRELRVRIISDATEHQWKNIANLVCSNVNVTTVMEQQYHGDPGECLKQKFIENFISKKPQNYSQDWNGLGFKHFPIM